MNRGFLVALAAAAVLLLAVPARAVDSEPRQDAPDLTRERALIKEKKFAEARDRLFRVVDTHQHADVYNLLGFALRKTGDLKNAHTYYAKALDLDPDHKGAHEYIGELHLETGRPEKAKEHHAALVRLCPTGCEERADLEEAMQKAGLAVPGR
jgi:Flp pilus assembly protein TadD